jgi:chemotaxis response regulator CheB
MNKAIRVLVANRPKLMRETVLAVLSDQPWIEIVGEVSSDLEIPDKVHELSPEVLVIAVDEPGKRPPLCDALLQELPSLYIIAVAPQQNYTVCYWATLDIRSDDFEPSEEGFLNAVRRVAEEAGVNCERRSAAGSPTV